jgi:hypothetical protein
MADRVATFSVRDTITPDHDICCDANGWWLEAWEDGHQAPLADDAARQRLAIGYKRGDLKSIAEQLHSPTPDGMMAARRVAGELEGLLLGGTSEPDDATLWDAPDGIERPTVVRIIAAALADAKDAIPPGPEGATAKPLDIDRQAQIDALRHAMEVDASQFAGEIDDHEVWPD